MKAANLHLFVLYLAQVTLSSCGVHILRPELVKLTELDAAMFVLDAKNAGENKWELQSTARDAKWMFTIEAERCTSYFNKRKQPFEMLLSCLFAIPDLDASNEHQQLPKSS